MEEKRVARELTSQQRAYLRSLANTLPDILFIGKEGLTESVIAEADTVIEAHELIKCSVLKNCDENVRDLEHRLAEAIGASEVQVIGRKFVLYRASLKKPKIVIK
ncbi:MAG: YhbY family RNA-binding protein [Clostridiales bacterium]|nr:YhbY family RNA-binding protein [Clostridiales bacterium]